jgi:hypothetical protein
MAAEDPKHLRDLLARPNGDRDVEGAGVVAVVAWLVVDAEPDRPRA